ncbi:MAG: methylated-DNA--[protein]-cysteine S-methyltransferase [Firmicutes bacterium]|nr:methylated-DNA--[protein]-cysteine S-methyltransferase [Bacillota bacterium]
MVYGYNFKTIIGEFGLLESNGKLVGVILPGESMPPNIVLKETDLLLDVKNQINNYLDGDIKEFNIPISYTGTDFMKSVWSALSDIPYGTTKSYKEIAIAIGSPKAARAIGMANNHNPLPIIIPCHRVIGSKGNLIGYKGGLNIKKQLLELERIVSEIEE